MAPITVTMVIDGRHTLEADDYYGRHLVEQMDSDLFYFSLLLTKENKMIRENAS